MGVLTDMLPQIEAEYRTRAILEYLGCIRLECAIEAWDDIARFGRWVRHNNETKFFEDIVELQPLPVFRSKDIRRGPVAYIQSDIAAWIASHHPQIQARLEQERQTAIDADPWRQHVVMVGML